MGGGRVFQAALASTQQREPEKLSLEIQSMVCNSASCSMSNILINEGETEPCSSTRFEFKRTNQSSHCLSLRKILYDMMPKINLVNLQTTFKVF